LFIFIKKGWSKNESIFFSFITDYTLFLSMTLNIKKNLPSFRDLFHGEFFHSLFMNDLPNFSKSTKAYLVNKSIFLNLTIFLLQPHYAWAFAFVIWRYGTSRKSWWISIVHVEKLMVSIFVFFVSFNFQSWLSYVIFFRFKGVPQRCLIAISEANIIWRLTAPFIQ